MTETIRAYLYMSEAEAHEDEWGQFIPLRRPIETSRNVFPKIYPRIIEILQLLGASSLMASPSEADFSNELAQDVAVPGFGSRQTLYEKCFLGLLYSCLPGRELTLIYTTGMK